MSYDASVSYSGNKSISTLGGQIRLEEGRGRLVIYDSLTGKEINIVDRTGYYLTDGVVSTKINPGNFIQNDGTHDRLFLGNED
jgi:hypothetical protein